MIKKLEEKEEKKEGAKGPISDEDMSKQEAKVKTLKEAVVTAEKSQADAKSAKEKPAGTPE